MASKIISFGEALWDIFPDNKAPGGATMNVALRSASLGHATQMISSIGKDELGEELKSIFEQNDVGTGFIQQHPSLETGKVFVKLDALGNGSYIISEPAAWDEIGITAEMKQAVQHSDALIFGSLSCRKEITANTLRQLLTLARFKIFDINLRPPFYTKDLLLELFDYADLIKMNDEELKIFGKYAGADSSDLKEITEYIAGKKTVCITLGENGAFIYANGKFIEHPGYKVKVADTVGAGDGFLAGLVSRILQGDNLPYALNFACALGALVASKPKANPTISYEEIETLIANKK